LQGAQGLAGVLEFGPAGIRVFPEVRGSPFQPKAKMVIIAERRKAMIGVMPDPYDNSKQVRWVDG